MNKGKRILIGDNSYTFGRLLSKALTDSGFDVMCRRSDALKLKTEILSCTPDVAVLFVYDEESPVIPLIADISSSGCPTKIIAVTYVSSTAVCRNIIDSGAERCIVMPVAVKTICTVVSEVSCAPRPIAFEPEIISFLVENNIPNHLKGFYYLSTSMGLCITDPEYITDLTKRLYPKLAEIYGTTPLLIERDLRHIALLAHENGSDLRLAGLSSNFSASIDTPLTNYELICIASDAFAQKYKIFR